LLAILRQGEGKMEEKEQGQGQNKSQGEILSKVLV
jgi:hypothetical protein